MKIEGHTHTELCPHGNGDSTAQMIERAIKLGFDEYHITEHAPLPTDFIRAYSGDPKNVATASLQWDQLADYFSLANRLKEKYQNKIKITIGFEVDYLEDYEKQISSFLRKISSVTENNIISVHYLKNKNGDYFGIDYSPDELKAGFSADLINGQDLYFRYFKTILKSVTAFADCDMPGKIGHMSLIKKYQDYFALPTNFSASNMALINQILTVAQNKQLKIDFNTTGLYKSYCNDIYPGKQIIDFARQKEIQFEFGSDAHSIREVGHGYHLFEYL
ncbi:histidinol-phosphatase HisJ [Limosilactobacillus reuteri]|uniref:histidinol-phosphatase HisJ n=3 Tax=Limosilactobacillus reuteri TaxID=1598 RepID=UPI000D6F1891|nr:histidinol-phosphatase HisJ [Limosilactobacillus reuteri]MCC4468198.1 histidinol-phosphatase HisJ [Limosilactobacillus reuteri]MCC4472100.1 histidinol-phosphatase HisJ [Limosilactobacillus reuteri]MCT3190347.1 histidinol-phosphatase HisJ [Limosilactobacillus reuteri]MCT3196779.1 histidinol-phosphatase HisJ [Limosilactobacillus reuteri]MDC6077235.1 histidinol-phosphatase HisJ [Limosilactobacillus reuteri]